jgi:hypothetical protein
MLSPLGTDDLERYLAECYFWSPEKETDTLLPIIDRYRLRKRSQMVM